MEKNLPYIKKVKIFTKVKNWFKGLLGIGKIEEPIQEPINNNITKKNEFKESIRVESKDGILSLQRKLEDEQIKISDLTDEELDKMIGLYKDQIIIKEDKIKHYRDTKEG